MSEFTYPDFIQPGKEYTFNQLWIESHLPETRARETLKRMLDIGMMKKSKSRHMWVYRAGG